MKSWRALDLSNAAATDNVGDITAALLRRSADYMLLIQLTQDRLQAQVERKAGGRAVVSQRLQAERKKSTSLSSALTDLD